MRERPLTENRQGVYVKAKRKFEWSLNGDRMRRLSASYHGASSLGTPEKY